jgi:hypothetical protein
MRSKVGLPLLDASDVGSALATDALAPEAETGLFLSLVALMSPLERRLIAVLMANVADTEARQGRGAALDLIDDLESFIRDSKASRLN